MLRAVAIGWRAHRALRASGGAVRVTAPLSRSFYGEAAGELVWVGVGDAALHPRAVLVSAAPAHGRRVTVEGAADVRAWRPPLRPPFRPSSRAASRLRTALITAGDRCGLARLIGAQGGGEDGGGEELVGGRARPCVAALTRACATDDAAAFCEAARPLLGLGHGLTPSGDDLVGGALFARRTVIGMDAGWEAASLAITRAAADLTHPISARLLADLAAGEGWAPLHDLTGALTDDTGDPMPALRRLVAIGHSSGWDVAAGLLIGLARR